ncbi:MAG: hypothetical protein RR338_01470 [Clostridia bacterium]
MPANKLNKKWYSLIWCALILASLVRSAYVIYTGYANLDDAVPSKIMLQVLMDIVFSGLLPAVLCYFCASIIFSMTWARRMRFSSKNDFVYIVMIATACARMLMGIIEIFCVLNPKLYAYTSLLLNETVLSVALLLMFFLVLKPKYMNDRVAYRVFNFAGPIYLAFQGLFTLAPCFLTFILSGNTANINPQIFEMLNQIGFGYPISNFELNACITATVIYVVLDIVAIALSASMRKKALECTEPDIPIVNPYGGQNGNQNNGNPYGGQNGNQNNPWGNGNPYNGNNQSNPWNGGNAQNGQGQNGSNDNPFDDNPFVEQKPKDDENVFDEFDI